MTESTGTPDPVSVAASELGRRGGASTSKRKRKAARKNIEKARAKRWAFRKTAEETEPQK